MFFLTSEHHGTRYGKEGKNQRAHCGFHEGSHEGSCEATCEGSCDDPAGLTSDIDFSYFCEVPKTMGVSFRALLTNSCSIYNYE